MNRFFQRFFLAILFIIVFFSCYKHTYAEPPDQLDAHESYIRGEVTKVSKDGLQNFQGIKTYTETLQVRLLEGQEKNQVVSVGYSTDVHFGLQQKIQAGDSVVIDSRLDPSGKMFYSVYAPYRINRLLWIVVAFVLLVVLIARKKGLGALMGLTISLLTITFFILPQILKGNDPLVVCLLGAGIILFLTTYIAHGVSIKTTIAIISTAISLGLAVLLSIFCVHAMQLLGLGNQDVYNLQIGTTHPINPRGLLLGSIVIGTLGALNDITTTQAITIFTLAKENPKQQFLHLFRKAMRIGEEHIASLVNTLVLAYAGSSLAIFTFFALNPVNLPWWLILNDETTLEEIVKTLVGSSALILAVPITTALACYVALYAKTSIINKIR